MAAVNGSMYHMSSGTTCLGIVFENARNGYKGIQMVRDSRATTPMGTIEPKEISQCFRMDPMYMIMHSGNEFLGEKLLSSFTSIVGTQIRDGNEIPTREKLHQKLTAHMTSVVLQKDASLEAILGGWDIICRLSIPRAQIGCGVFDNYADAVWEPYILNVVQGFDSGSRYASCGSGADLANFYVQIMVDRDGWPKYEADAGKLLMKAIAFAARYDTSIGGLALSCLSIQPSNAWRACESMPIEKLQETHKVEFDFVEKKLQAMAPELLLKRGH